MAKVKNLTNRHLEVLRWKILPLSGTMLSSSHHLVDDMPNELAYSDTMKRLADEGLVEIEGYTPPANMPPPPAPKTEPVVPKVKKPRPKDE